MGSVTTKNMKIDKAACVSDVVTEMVKAFKNVGVEFIASLANQIINMVLF